MLVSLLFACTPLKLSDDVGTEGQANDSADTAATDSGSDDSGSGDSADTNVDTATEGLHGEWPQNALPVPDFDAKNLDNSPRSKPDLVGHPTVVWFYPLAGSSG